MPIPPRNQPDYNYSLYVAKHGTREEIERLHAETVFARDLRAAFPGSAWEPMQVVRLIDHLVRRADKLAARRLDQAKKLRYRDWQGKVGRTLAEERATVRAQFALQLCLDLPLGKPDTYQEARRVGNAGGGHDAFLPLHNLYRHNLIVDPRTPDATTCWLVVDEGGHTYRLRGWISAAEAKTFKVKERHREGGVSRAHWIHPDALYSVAEWWDK